jgi:hypothetical protein
MLSDGPKDTRRDLTERAERLAKTVLRLAQVWNSYIHHPSIVQDIEITLPEDVIGGFGEYRPTFRHRGIVLSVPNANWAVVSFEAPHPASS